MTMAHRSEDGLHGIASVHEQSPPSGSPSLLAVRAGRDDRPTRVSHHPLEQNAIHSLPSAAFSDDFLRTSIRTQNGSQHPRGKANVSFGTMTLSSAGSLSDEVYSRDDLVEDDNAAEPSTLTQGKSRDITMMQVRLRCMFSYLEKLSFLCGPVS